MVTKNFDDRFLDIYVLAFGTFFENTVDLDIHKISGHSGDNSLTRQQHSMQCIDDILVRRDHAWLQVHTFESVDLLLQLGHGSLSLRRAVLGLQDNTGT